VPGGRADLVSRSVRFGEDCATTTRRRSTANILLWAFRKREQIVGLDPIRFRFQVFAAFAVFRNHNPNFFVIAARPKPPSAFSYAGNRLVLRHPPSRSIAIESPDVMNAVVCAGSTGFIDAADMDINGHSSTCAKEIEASTLSSRRVAHSRDHFAAVLSNAEGGKLRTPSG
jgi:hypothetical protein